MNIATKVIIVDDAAPLRAVLRTLLKQEGYDVVGEHASGAGLLDDIARSAPDIVCLDHNLPDTTGLELLKAIHADHPTVAVVMISGSDMPELASAAAEAGASGFIHKPFTQDRIVRELQQVALAQRLLALAHKSGKPLAVTTARARAVIADDSATVRMLLAAILTEASIEVVGEAGDGKQAVELVAARKPDIVCLDIDMPVMNGIEALQLIHAQHPEARVMMVTGNADRQHVAQAGQHGARGYILKPFHPHKVVEAIDKLLALR